MIRVKVILKIKIIVLSRSEYRSKTKYHVHFVSKRYISKCQN